MTVEKAQRRDSSHLFTVRLWGETVSEGRTEWRGKVQHVLSGESRYFRDWPTLVAFLVDASARLEPDGHAPEEADG